MGAELNHPVVWLSLGAVALTGSSFSCAWLARQILAGLPERTVRGQLLAGLTACVPVIGLVFALTVTGRTNAATTAGSGAGLTYLLIVPAVLLGKTPLGGAWTIWRRAVLPFCLATAATWVIIATTGHFRPLDGQFLITLFVLGTWLFSLESRTARTAVNPSLTPLPAGGTLDGTRTESGTVVAVPATRAAGNRMAAVLVSVAATVLTAVAALVLAAGQTRWADSLIPLLGGLTCAGPVLIASRDAFGRLVGWLGGLGYAAMAGACLVPGIAGFVQPGLAAPPLYGPDGAFLALAAGVLLSLGEEGLMASRMARRLVVGTWVIWLIWIVFSVLFALSPVVQSPAPDPSVWESP